VPLVGQEMLTLPEHLSSHPVFSGIHVAQILVICGVFYRSLFVLFVLAIVLSVLLKFTDSAYPYWYLETFRTTNNQIKGRMNVTN